MEYIRLVQDLAEYLRDVLKYKDHETVRSVQGAFLMGVTAFVLDDGRVALVVDHEDVVQQMADELGVECLGVVSDYLEDEVIEAHEDVVI